MLGTNKLNTERLQEEYSRISGSLASANEEANRQISKLLSNERIAPAVPIESRLKTWASIEEKIKRKNLAIDSVKELNDLVGFRIILLFSQDVDRTLARIERLLSVVDKEDKRATITEDQFGYQSVHCVGYFPGGWLALPTLKDFDGIKVEIQIRTVAQHLWAAASHLLQYKREENIPLPLRRSIHRMSALLEIVDLEFDRVLKEREIFRKGGAKPSDEEFLNVDYIEMILDQTFPQKNKTPGSEHYDLVLDYYRIFGLDTVGMFRNILMLAASSAIEYDQLIVNGYRHNNLAIDEERIKQGVFWNHGALATQALANVLEKNEDPTDKSLALGMRKAKTEKRIKDYLEKPTDEEKQKIIEFFGNGPIEEAIETRGMRFGLSKESRQQITNLTKQIQSTAKSGD